MVFSHRPVAPSSPARAVRRTKPITRFLAVGIFCALTYSGLTAGAFGPASDLAETRANLDFILAELKRQSVPTILAGMRSAPNMGKAYAAEFEGIYPALARKYGAKLYPFFLNGVTGNRALVQSDGMHPNPRGVDVVVRGIQPTVSAALR